MKNITLILLSFLVTATAWAQDEVDTSWTKGGLGTLSFSQVSLKNWAAGGENAISGTAFVNLFASYHKGDVSWENTLDFAYGLTKQGDSNPLKTDDKIDFASKYGKKVNKNWYLSGLLGFRTQFDLGFDYPETGGRQLVSKWLAPAYLLASIGMDYKPTDNFSLLIAPITGKVTIVANDELSNLGAFGVAPGEQVRTEFGAYVKIAATKDLIENINIATKLDLFTNYSESPIVHTDVNWEIMIAMKINEYLTTNLFLNYIYDHDIKSLDASDGRIKPQGQFKEVFGLGLSYKI